jgi:hypothetical protein
MALDDDSPAKPKFGAKSDFVRSLDRHIPAAQVVALAQKRGLELTTSFVYNIRSNGNPKSNGNGATHGQQRERESQSQAKTKGAEAMLRASIAQVGLVKAREILEEVEATFAGLRP